MKIKKFNMWLNELQSTEAPIQSGGGESAYSYGNIQDILGSKYNFTVKPEKLEEFEEIVLSKESKNKKDDDYFAKRFVEHTRNRLTPPFQDDLIMNNDFNARSVWDEVNSDKEEGKKIATSIKEDGGVGCANAGNVGGMGAVVTSQPSSIPGNTAGATTGSGDIGSGWIDSKNNNRNVIARPIGSRRKKKMKAKVKEMFKNMSNQFKGGEYKQGGDKNATIMSFRDFSKK